MEELFENWSETKAALLDGLPGSKQAVVAPLLENQKNHLLAESAAGGSGVTIVRVCRSRRNIVASHPPRSNPT